MACYLVADAHTIALDRIGHAVSGDRGQRELPLKRLPASAPQKKSTMKIKINIRLIMITFAAGFVGVSPMAMAVTRAPDGGYANDNTAEGTNALSKLTTGVNNSAIGFEALFSNTTGGSNTAIGFDALVDNTAGGSNTAIGFETLLTNSTGVANTASSSGALP